MMLREELKPYTKLLSCKLTEAERLAAADELGQVVQDIQAEEDRQASVKQELKARLAVLEARKTELATKVTRKEEMREVRIQPFRDYENNRYFECREDTFETIKDRPLTAEERQMNIPEVPPEEELAPVQPPPAQDAPPPQPEAVPEIPF